MPAQRPRVTFRRAFLSIRSSAFESLCQDGRIRRNKGLRKRILRNRAPLLFFAILESRSGFQLGPPFALRLRNCAARFRTETPFAHSLLRCQRVGDGSGKLPGGCQQCADLAQCRQFFIQHANDVINRHTSTLAEFLALRREKLPTRGVGKAAGTVYCESCAVGAFSGGEAAPRIASHAAWPANSIPITRIDIRISKRRDDSGVSP